MVFKTGGLVDTVTEDDGFVFDKYKKEDLIKTIDKAIRAFRGKKKWLGLMRRAIQSNFSWRESAKEYVALYEKAKSK